MSASVWFRLLSAPAGLDCEAILAGLSAAGIDMVRLSSSQLSAEGPETCGVIFYSHPDPRVIDVLSCAGSGRRHRIIAVTDSEDLDSAAIWSLIDAGASDVINLAGQTLVDGVNKLAFRLEHWLSVSRTIDSPRVASNLVGGSHTWRIALRNIAAAALDPDLSVLITGESGTGKELAAQLIHSIDARRKERRFVVVDCTTIVPELSGSEFFGHERGAFTGANSRRDGAFALADGGTLFLDEVGELPVLLQAELLRVVQEKRYKPVGSNTWKTTGFRLICATNRDLEEQVGLRQFRSDLYHRLATWTCKLPALRDRTEDILPLAKHFFSKMGSLGECPKFDPAVAEYLTKREYPGNVRELLQLVRRIACMNAGAGLITCGDIPEADRPARGDNGRSWVDDGFEKAIRRAISQGANLDEIRHAAENIAEIVALQQAGQYGNGTVARAAKMLNINRRTLEMHIKNRSDRIRSLAH